MTSLVGDLVIDGDKIYYIAGERGIIVLKLADDRRSPGW